MRNEVRLSLNVERDLVWGLWPDEEPDEDVWEEENLTLTQGSPNQIIID